MKILVRSPNWIGDQVLAYPFFVKLRNRFPDAVITVVCSPRVQEIQYQELINETVVQDKPMSSALIERFRSIERTANKLKNSGPFDFGFSLPNSLSSAWLLFRAGVKKRIGYGTEGRGLLLNHSVRWSGDPAIHRSQAYLNLISEEKNREFKEKAARYWGEWGEDDEYIDSGYERKFQSNVNWPTQKIIEPPCQRYFIIGPGATAESRRWGMRSYAKFAELVIQQFDFKPVIVGGPQEAPLAEELIKRWKIPAVDFTAKSGIPGLSLLFEKAEFCICNESGLAHLSSLFGCLTYIVCGAADPNRTKPIGPGQVKIAINPVECWPCEKNVCYQDHDQYLQCLRGINADRVFEEIRNYINEKAQATC